MDTAPSGPELRSTPLRDRALARASNLEYLTVGWNVLEGIIAVVAALAAGIVALLGFGIDSFVESASGAVFLWRLRAERTARNRGEIEDLDRKARKLVGLSLFLLALFVAVDAVWTLWDRATPEPSFVGIALTAVSIGVSPACSRSVEVDRGHRAASGNGRAASAAGWPPRWSNSPRS
jgi:hypothetical protein